MSIHYIVKLYTFTNKTNLCVIVHKDPDIVGSGYHRVSNKWLCPLPVYVDTRPTERAVGERAVMNVRLRSTRDTQAVVSDIGGVVGGFKL